MIPTTVDEYFSHCPYCGEAISLLVDPSAINQSYIEDCEVCCRPITVRVSGDEESITVTLLQENDTP